MRVNGMLNRRFGPRTPATSAPAAHDGPAAPATAPTTRTEDVDVTVDVVVNGHVTSEVSEHLWVPEGATEHIVVTEHRATQGQSAPALPIAPLSQPLPPVRRTTPRRTVRPRRSRRRSPTRPVSTPDRSIPRRRRFLCTWRRRTRRT